jgi:hypothetical protein
LSDDPASLSEPTPTEASGLRGARLAARVRQALYNLPSSELAEAHERMRAAAVERHMDYFHEGRVETIRVLPCPITLLPEQLVYLHSVTRTLHYGLLRMPELYFGDPAVHDLLRLDPVEDEWLRSCWTPAVQARIPVFDRLDCMVDYASPIWKDTLRASHCDVRDDERSPLRRAPFRRTTDRRSRVRRCRRRLSADPRR